MGKVLTLILSLAMAIGAQAASLNLNEISEIYVNDAAKNLLIVRTNNGKLMRLKVTPARREAIVQAINGTQAEEIVEINSTEGTTTISDNSNDDELLLLENSEGTEEKIISEASTSRSASAASAGTTSTTVENIEEKKSPWSFGLLTISSMKSNDLQELKGSINNYIQVTVGYKLSEDWKFAVKPNVSLDYSLDQGNATNNIGNIPLQLSRGKFAEVAGFGVSGTGRFYLPTSYGSKKSGTNGQARLMVNASRPLSKLFSLDLDANVRYNLQSNRSTAEFDEFGRLTGTPTANTSWQGGLDATVGMKLTEGLSLSQGIGVFHSLKFDDPELDTDNSSTTNLSIGTGLAMSYLKPLTLMLTIGQTYSLSKGDGFALYNPDETGASFWMILPL